MLGVSYGAGYPVGGSKVAQLRVGDRLEQVPVAQVEAG